MGINDFLKRTCTQTAVYWANPVADGYGDRTYDDAVEIKCRWQNKNSVIKSANGEEIVVTAEVFVTQDLDEQGMLWLGDLDDLDSDPQPVASGASLIVKVDKSPSLGSTSDFIRKVYLK